MNAEGVFIGGNGFRAIGVIKALEDSLDRPVLTANQVAFWCAQRDGPSTEVTDEAPTMRVVDQTRISGRSL